MSLLTLFNFPPSGQPTSFADDLNAAMEPWITDDLETYNEAIGTMFQPIGDLVYPIGNDGDQGYVPPWGKLFDPDLCPSAYLAYLAQFVGVTIPDGTPDATARALIREEAGFKRGTRESIIAAVKRNLSGTQSVFLAERVKLNGAADPYWMVIVVKPGDVFPSGQRTWSQSGGTWAADSSSWGGQVTVIQNAIAAVKPAGVQYSLLITDSPAWAARSRTWSAATNTWDAAAIS